VYRVLKEGGDRRFTKVKTKPTVFLIYWMVQGNDDPIRVLFDQVPLLLLG